MKIKSIFLIASILVFYSCEDLDLTPPDQASSENWYTTENEVEMALNDQFRQVFWPPDDVAWTDDYIRRTILNPITDGTINGEWGVISSNWLLKYKAISRANRILENIEEDKAGLNQQTKDIFAGNAHFSRAAQYSYLINHWGDVPHYTESLTLDEAFALNRTEKNTVLESIYEDFDAAISMLPEEYGGKQFATKGAALAMKARTALYNEDWAIARDAAKATMDLGYELYPNYGELFKSDVSNPDEVIFSIPVSSEYDSYSSWPPIGATATISRNAGGHANNAPSWMLMSAFLCTDGLPIDESPLYNPQEPFENRDPRLSEVIVPHGEVHLGFTYAPHPDSTEVLNWNNGSHVSNQDTRSVQQYASYNGLLWKKGVEDGWAEDHRVENELIIMRYADVLLMYAEAKIELNDIDQTVLDAINRVRARAYGVNYTETSEYPAVTTMDQDNLRTQLRTERRMELAYEGRRYMDIIRWELAEDVLNRGSYGMLNPDQLEERVMSEGLWFFPDTPEIDENAVADFEPMYNRGLIRRLNQRNFDATKQYLWPIPTSDIQINDNIEQNDGY